MSDDYCKLLMKKTKAHERAVVGLEFVKDPVSRKLKIISFAHNSIKFWNVVSSEEGFEIFEQREINASYCGMQSYDVANQGRLIAVVSVESTIHTINLMEENDNVKVNSFNKGLMEAWYLKILNDTSQFFTVSFSGLLRVIRDNGEWDRQYPFDKVKLISAVTYSPTGSYLAVGNSHGWIYIIDPVTLATSFTIEAHSSKIRCLQFTPDESHILSGSNDKTVKLYSLAESKGTLVRTFCGHRQSVMALCVDKSSAGDRFCSVALDGRLILWDISSGSKLHVFEHTTADFFTCVTFSPDGHFIVAATDEATILSYRIPRSENFVMEEGDTEEMTKDDYAYNLDASLHANEQNSTPRSETDIFGGSISPASAQDHEDTPPPENGFDRMAEHSQFNMTLPGETTLSSTTSQLRSPNLTMLNTTAGEEPSYEQMNEFGGEEEQHYRTRSSPDYKADQHRLDDNDYDPFEVGTDKQHVESSSNNSPAPVGQYDSDESG